MFKLVFYHSQGTSLPYCEKVLNGFVYTLTPVEAEKVSVGYLIKDNILMRKWSSHHVTIAPLLLLMAL